MEPYEQINIWEIAAKGDIKVLNKIFVVFGALNKEILYLKVRSWLCTLFNMQEWSACV